MIVLDTNVLSEMLKVIPDARVINWFEGQSRSDLFVTATTIAELLFGIERMPDGRRKRILMRAAGDMLAGLLNETLPFDDGAARIYAELAAHREATGRVIGLADGQIAAICRHRGMTLATRNVRNFAGTGVALVNPWDAA